MDEFIIIDEADLKFIDKTVKNNLAASQKNSRHRNDNLDPGSGYFFARELEYIYSETLKADLPEANFNKLFAVDSAPREGQKSYTQRIYEPVGKAEIIANMADDLPRVNVVKREETRGIHYLGDSYGYSVQDIMSAQFAGDPLDATLGEAAREAIERGHNDLCFFGSPEYKIWGVLRHPYIPRYLFSEEIGASATDADAIIDQINALINSVNRITKTVAVADTLALPPAEYDYIHQTRIPDTMSTIAEFILKAHPGLEMYKCWELDADLNEGTALALAYRKSATNAKYVAPVVFRQLPVERRNLEFVTNCLGVSGGFYSPRPLHLCVGELVRPS